MKLASSFPAVFAVLLLASHVAPPTTAAKEAAKKPNVLVAKKRAGYVVGRVLNMANKPLANVEIGIFGTTINGDRARFETRTNASGLFFQRVPDGIYGIAAYYQTTYNGKNYRFTLAPEDGITSVSHDAEGGIVKNFRWKISGLKPGERTGTPNTHTEGIKYYGGYILVSSREKGFGGEYVYFPKDSVLSITLTPRARLIDGSTGKPLTFTRRAAKDEMSGISWYLENVPVGLYTIAAKLKAPDGTVTPVGIKPSIPFDAPYTASARVDFEPTNFGDMQMMQISVEPPILVGK